MIRLGSRPSGVNARIHTRSHTPVTSKNSTTRGYDRRDHRCHYTHTYTHKCTLNNNFTTFHNNNIKSSRSRLYSNSENWTIRTYSVCCSMGKKKRGRKCQWFPSALRVNQHTSLSPYVYIIYLYIIYVSSIGSFSRGSFFRFAILL